MPLIAKSTRAVRVRLRRSKDGQHYFVLVAGNGESVAVSETYTRRADAIRGARRFQQLVADAVT